uniref:Uncharacterized protein n=1 Tax=Arundo donax TaxID=35708 RepID=A0A0A8YFN4_ARUDO
MGRGLRRRLAGCPRLDRLEI